MNETTMTPRNNASRRITTLRGGLIGVLALALAGVAVVGCERALQLAPSSSVLMLTTPGTTVPLNGEIPITATLTDGSGKPVAEGTIVTFSSNLGVLHPPEGHVGNGRTTTTLRAGTTPGVATITASSGGVTSNALSVRVGDVPVPPPVTPVPPPAVADRIELNATADAGNTATVLATVFDTTGSVLPGALVTFTTSSGTIASSVVRTNSLGQAANLVFGTYAAVVTAETGGLRASVAVRLNVESTLSVNVAISPVNPLRRQNVVFTATATLSGIAPAVVLRYEWVFSDGVVVTTTGNQTSRAFETEGVYAVTVQVFTTDGSVGISRNEFYVD
jgi:hypothetical protein